MMDLLTSMHQRHGKKLNDFAIKCWWEATKHLEFEQVLSAFSEHYKRSRYAPTEKDILDIVSDRGSNQRSHAWDAVKETKLRELRDDYDTALLDRNYTKMREVSVKLTALEIMKMNADVHDDRLMGTRKS